MSEVTRMLAPCQRPQLVGVGLPQAERVGSSGDTPSKIPQGLALPLPGCVILGKSLNFSEPQRPPLKVTAPTAAEPLEH